MCVSTERNQSDQERAQSEAAGGGGSIHALRARGTRFSSPRPVSQQRQVQEEGLQTPQASQTPQTAQTPKDPQSP